MKPGDLVTCETERHPETTAPVSIRPGPGNDTDNPITGRLPRGALALVLATAKSQLGDEALIVSRDCIGWTPTSNLELVPT